MFIEKLADDLQKYDGFGSPVPDDWDALPELKPHRATKLEGVLCCGVTQPQSRERLFNIVIPSLTNLIGKATDWGEAPENESRLGDFRFLVVSFPTRGGVDAYVQMWSEARGSVIIEVGPGDRPDCSCSHLPMGSVMSCSTAASRSAVTPTISEKSWRSRPELTPQDSPGK